MEIQYSDYNAYVSNLFAANTIGKQNSTYPDASTSSEAEQKSSPTYTYNGGLQGSLSEEMNEFLSLMGLDKRKGKLPQTVKNGLDHVVADKEYAKKLAQTLGTQPDTINIHPSVWERANQDPEFAQKLEQQIADLKETISQVQKQRQGYYDDLMSKGYTHEQAYSNMLEFNSDLPKDYWDSLNIGYEPGTTGRTRAQFDKQHEYLQLALDAAGRGRTPEQIQDAFYMELAMNPERAMAYANQMSNSYDALWITGITLEEAIKSGNMSKITSGYAMDDPNNPVIQMQRKKKAYFNQLVEQGLEPTEILQKMFEFQANIPASYGNDLDYGDSYPTGYWHNEQQKNLDLFLSKIEKLKSYSEASVSAELPATLQDTLDNILSETQEGKDYTAAHAANGYAHQSQTPEKGSPNSVWAQYHQDNESNKKLVEEVNQERQNTYHELASQNLPVSDIYKGMLTFDLAQPETYWNSIDPSGNLKTQKQNELSYLNQARSKTA